MEFRLLGIVVLYKPTIEMINKIVCWIDYVDHLIVWDNTPDSENSIEYQSILEQYKAVTFFGKEGNLGLSYPYNKAIEFAKHHGFSHLLTMDQDSEWVDFPLYKKHALSYFQKHALAIVSPETNSHNEGNIRYERINFAINSGSIISIACFDKIGRYCERFLIDAVDTEFNFRALRNNIPIVKILGSGYIKQQFGESDNYTFLGLHLCSYNYSPFRLYGILRNSVLLMRMYPERIELRSHIKRIYLKHYVFSIIYRENNKIKKLYALYKGLIDGFLTKKSLDPKYSKA